MKKVLVLGFMFLFLGCASNKSGTTEVMKIRRDAPAWANGKTAADTFYGIGFAKKQNAALAKSAATARARTEISNAVNVKVSAMMKDFIQESGVGDNAQALEFSSVVTKQVTSNTLEGSIIDSTYFAKDGTVWVLVSMPVSKVRELALDAAKNEEALYNEFKASQALQELDAETKK